MLPVPKANRQPTGAPTAKPFRKRHGGAKRVQNAGTETAVFSGAASWENAWGLGVVISPDGTVVEDPCQLKITIKLNTEKVVSELHWPMRRERPCRVNQ
jgi:hypothetical protein